MPTTPARNGNGATWWKAAIGGFISLAIAAIIALVSMGNRVTANTTSIRHNCETIKDIKEDTSHRLDRMEDTLQEILRELRK